MQQRNLFLFIAACASVATLHAGLFHHKKYETPITKDTLQPDKILFDKAINNIEHGNYEAARLTLETLINTYDTSEYLAKAKLAVADSWYREGGAHGLAQAEAEYKDFILFYPTMEEAAESQYRICQIHYKQMDKPDRDSAQGQRAEDECRQVMVQFPNSKFVKPAEQMLRNVQEVLADKEYRTGDFYHHRGSFPAAASRLLFVTHQYPLYSGSDEALWELADSYHRMGDRFEPEEADALSRILKDYPLSAHAGEAKDRLNELKQPIPQADPQALARMKYEEENRTKPGIMSRMVGPFSGRPDVRLAAKAGDPPMKAMRPNVPVSVPETAAGGQTGISDVTASVGTDTTALDKGQDARLSARNVTGNAPVAGEGENKASVGSNGQTVARNGAQSTPAATQNQPLPTNHPLTKQQLKMIKKAQEKAAKKQKKTKTPAAQAQPAVAGQPTPASAGQPTVTQPSPGQPPSNQPTPQPLSPATGQPQQ
ncbi:MAG TPA: outer membrane protein assembly factor BamD [Bryobacteraceae bacterium]|nr:outer membrane protein assembly factor BamD [Bryobacteraceae bacterium]